MILYVKRLLVIISRAWLKPPHIILNPAQVLNSIGEPLRYPLDLHRLVRLLIVLALPQILRHIDVLKEGPGDGLQLATALVHRLRLRMRMLVYVYDLNV
jgi:hypothetical protein